MDLNVYFLPAVSTFVLSVVLNLIALKVFPKLKLMDHPERYGLNRKPIPYCGGISIFLSFLISVLIFVPLTLELMGFLFGALVIVLVGFLDDLFSLKPWVRLIFQFLAGIILIASGIYVLSFNLPFFGILDLNRLFVLGVPLLASFFAILWVMTILNAMNFVDGISGITSGVSFIAAITIFFLSIHPQIHADPSSQQGVATLAMILSMTALGFLVFDFPKARMLMGDTGSTFFGFTLATLAIFSGGKVATAFLVLGVVVLDMIWVIFRRIRNGGKFWHGDKKHLHHRLLEAGLSEKQVVYLYLILTVIFGVFAVTFVSTQQKFFIAIGLVILMFLLALALIFVPKKK